eukprot:scaffold5152_cov79-Skeletonema_dohrnii-CCMP3373.AAC.2
MVTLIRTLKRIITSAPPPNNKSSETKKTATTTAQTAHNDSAALVYRESTEAEEGGGNRAAAERKKYIKRFRRECSAEGCTNKAKRGGVCVRHGAKVNRCSSEGCPNQVVQGGVCARHGAKLQRMYQSIQEGRIVLKAWGKAEECAKGMGQRSNSNYAAGKDVQTKLSKEEYVRGTEPIAEKDSTAI